MQNIETGNWWVTALSNLGSRLKKTLELACWVNLEDFGGVSWKNSRLLKAELKGQHWLTFRKRGQTFESQMGMRRLLGDHVAFGKTMCLNPEVHGILSLSS